MWKLLPNKALSPFKAQPLGFKGRSQTWKRHTLNYSIATLFLRTFFNHHHDGNNKRPEMVLATIHKTENCQPTIGISVPPFSIQVPVLGSDCRDCFSKWRLWYYPFPEGQKVKPPGWESTTNKCGLDIWWLLPLEGKFGPGNSALKLAKCGPYKCDDFMVAT